MTLLKKYTDRGGGQRLENQDVGPKSTNLKYIEKIYETCIICE